MVRAKLFICLFVLLFLPALSFSADRVVAKSKTDVSFKNEVENAIGKGLTWLASQQKGGGWWAQEEHPALTALVLTSFQGDPTKFYLNKYGEQINKGYSYLLKNVKPDGSIYGKDVYVNYNTAVCAMALVFASRPEYENVIKKARAFLIGSQHDEGEAGMGDSPYDGGIGYGRTDKNPDLSNTVLALEAIYYTRYLKTEMGKDQESKDLNYKAALQFITRTQQLPGYNDQPWVSDDPDNKGGFVYFPGNSRAGEMKTEEGKTALRSYGSMSYAGLLSYIYAQMDKNDPRVKAVYDWLTRHYTLDENPGFGANGQYYYYYTMTKALTLYGANSITLKDGRTINWRYELAQRLMDLQKPDGFWVNDKSSRWWENDPVLVTSYTVMALEMMWRGL
ncbi:MAG: terpene cyclase/mutase family protein [Nitrospirales bacterium]|nr:terpene cyclase/mutase family protein [Nitrospirales bacterium]